MKKLIFTLCFVIISLLTGFAQITWMGNEYTTLGSTQYLGDNILFEIQSYPQHDNQGAQVYIDWNNDGYGSTQNVDWFALSWISQTGNNSKWNNYVTMTTVGTHNRRYLGWQSGYSNYVTNDMGTFTVSALSDPTSLSAATASNTQINLSWSQWNSKNVMIVRSLTSDHALTTSTQGVAYTVGTALGTGTVVYNNSGTSFNDTGLVPGNGYTYTFYSENNSYYSTGTTASATTTAVSSATDYFRSNATGNWSSTAIWQSSSDNTNWISATLVPEVSATAITIMSGNTVTLDQNTSVSLLTINTGGTFIASDGTARTLTIDKSTSGTSTTLANNGTWTNGTGGSTVVFTGAPGSGDAIHAISGTIAFQNITINSTGNNNIGASFGTNSSLTGTLEIGAGGFVSTAPPTNFYANSAILKFNQGSSATYDVNTSDYSWSTSVIPNNITISSGIVNLKADRTAIGDLIINGGTLNLAANLTIDGNWTRSSGTFTPKTYTVTLSGTSDGNVNATGGGSMYNIVIDKTSGAKVNLLSSLTVTNALTINAGSKLTLGSGNTLTVATFNINSDPTNGTGTYVDNGTTTVNGTATVQQYLGTARNWYISSPVSNALTTSGFTYYKRDEVNASWPTVAADGTTTFVPGTGYIALPATTGSTLTFSTQSGGSLNTGDISVPLTKESATTSVGYNLIGNPYPCNLTWTKAFVTNNSSLINPTIWYRTNAGTTNNSGQWSFLTYNAVSEEGSPTTANGIIPPMQAFWVNSLATGTLTLNSDLTKSHQSSNPLKARASVNNSTDRQRLRLVVSNGTSTDETLVYFDANAANGYDAYDSPKFPDTTAPVQIYTTAGTEQLVINGMNSIPYNTELPLGFTTSQSNAFSINAAEFSNFDTSTKVYLKDNLTSSEQDLTDGTPYTFASDVASTTSRFSVVFKSVGIATGVQTASGDKAVLIYKNANNQIAVNCTGTISSNAYVVVYNALGQKLELKRITSSTTVIGKTFTSGVYVVTVNNGGKSTTKKVIIN